MRACIRYSIVSFLALALVLFVGRSTVVAGLDVDSWRVTPVGEKYKDSFYFNYSGKYYLAVSDLDRGGISILRGGNNGTQDSNYTFYDNIPVSGGYAPQVYFFSGANAYIFYTHFAFNNSRLKYFTYNVVTKNNGSAQYLNIASPYGLTDPTVWYESGKNRWYLIAAKWTTGVPGCWLVWSSSTNGPLGPYASPQALKDQYNKKVDYDQRGSDIDYVVEGPIWSWWDHDSDGYHELYWSIGPCDPYKNGQCSTFIQAIRRGDIKFSGNTPWIEVWGYYGGNGDIMSSDQDCWLLTHPDFTWNGKIRASGHQGGVNNGYHCIVNTNAE